MFRIEKGEMAKRSELVAKDVGGKKFGVALGQVTIVFNVRF